MYRFPDSGCHNQLAPLAREFAVSYYVRIDTCGICQLGILADEKQEVKGAESKTIATSKLMGKKKRKIKNLLGKARQKIKTVKDEGRSGTTKITKDVDIL